MNPIKKIENALIELIAVIRSEAPVGTSGMSCYC